VAIFEDLEEPITDQGINGLAARLRESEFVDAYRVCRDDWPGRPSDEVLSKAFAAMHNEVLLRSSDIHERGWFFEDRW
jgi:hypothetical protein